MKRKIDNNDWTDALKDSLKDFELTPSESLFERIEADCAPGPKKAAWWWQALAVAAAITAVGLFVFRPKEIQTDRTAQELPETEIAAPADTARNAESLNAVSGKAESLSPAEGLIATRRQAENAAEKPADAETAAAGVPDVEEIVASAPFREETRVAVAGPEKAEAGAENSVSAELPATGETSANASGTAAETSEQEQASANTGSDAASKEQETAPETAVKRYPGPEDGDRKGTFEPVMNPKYGKKNKRKITVGVSFSSGLLASAANVTPGKSGSGMKKAAGRYDISDFLEHRPQTSSSIDLFIPVSDRFHIETGLAATELHASFRDIKQELGFTGIPLRLGYTCLDWGWGDVSVNAGGMWEYCATAQLMDKSYKESPQWSASAGFKASIHYRNQIGVYASPSLSYYFTDTNLPTIRSRHPLYLSFCAGLYIGF